jgi:uncharacterized membrane protein
MFEHSVTWAAVLGAVAYGAGDFIGGCAARRLGTFVAVAIAQVVAVAFLLQGQAFAQEPLPQGMDVWSSVAAGIAYAIGVMAIYEGLAHGRIAVVASICGLLSIVVPLAGDLVLGRPITSNEFIGIVLCATAAIVIVSASRANEKSNSVGWSVRMGVLSGLGFGMADLSLGTMPPELASGALLLTRSTAAALAVVLALGMIGRAKPSFLSGAAPTVAFAATAASRPSTAPAQTLRASPGLGTWVALAVAAGLLDTLGQLGYVHAATRGSMGVAAAIIAIFPGITVLLGAVFLRERITRLQTVGFGFGAMGITTISI